ncbi:hypothetical protein D3C76_810760 [compost metagenome]
MQLTEDDFKRLDQMDKEANARMSERDFTQRLLPHLLPNGAGENVRVDIFVAAAGHANRMIDVVDGGGNVLFTVPPLLSPTPMTIRSINARPDTDIGELTAEFEAQVTTNQPGLVIDGFVQRLMALNYSPSDAISAVYGLMWAKIYRRYNIPLELMFGENAPEVAKQLGVLGGDADKEASPARKTLDEIDDDDIEPL